MECTKKELAELFGVSVASVNKYIADGMPGRRGAGAKTRYELTEVLPWFVSLQVTFALKSRAVDGAPATYDIETLNAELVHWKVEREKHRSLQESGELVPVATVDRELNHRLTQVRDSLDAIPGSWSPFMVGITDLETAQRRLTEQLDQLYHTLSSLPDSALEADAYESSEVSSDVVVEIDDPDDS